MHATDARLFLSSRTNPDHYARTSIDLWFDLLARIEYLAISTASNNRAALYYLSADRIPVAVIPARTQNSVMSETLLDVKGMNCPLPVLRANRSLRGMAPGERLRVLATDRAAVADFQSFCRETGHALLAWSEENGVFSFVIRRRPEPAEPKDA